MPDYFGAEVEKEPMRPLLIKDSFVVLGVGK
jgi:hypothetical protein